MQCIERHACCISWIKGTTWLLECCDAKSICLGREPGCTTEFCCAGAVAPEPHSSAVSGVSLCHQEHTH